MHFASLENPVLCKIKRLCPKGHCNPNINKPYENKEEKLKEYFDMFSNTPPIILDRIDDSFSDSMIINPADIIGYATSFDDEYFYIKTDSYMHDMFFECADSCAIDVKSLVDYHEEDEKIKVKKVLKLILRKGNLN